MPHTRDSTKILIDAAEAVLGAFDLGPEASGFSAASCAAAVLTASGDVITGVCIDVSCGIGFCAEHAAIAEMLKTRQTRIVRVVAVVRADDGHGVVVIPPCGRCRELMMQIDPRNALTEVVLPDDRIAPLSRLLPEH